MDVYRLAETFSCADLLHECGLFIQKNAPSILKSLKFYEVAKEFVINGINQCNTLTVFEKTKVSLVKVSHQVNFIRGQMPDHTSLTTSK